MKTYKLITEQYFDNTFKKLSKRDKTKVLKLLKAILENPTIGIGKPEALKNNLSGYYSRRINKKDRLIYRIENNEIIIAISCKGHY